MLTPFAGLSTQRTAEQMVTLLQAHKQKPVYMIMYMNNQDFNVPRERRILNMIKPGYTC